jgi:hypothetical protein
LKEEEEEEEDDDDDVIRYLPLSTIKFSYVVLSFTNYISPLQVFLVFYTRSKHDTQLIQESR